MVSPTGLQEGAAEIAASQNIVPVQLNREVTPYEYVLKFLKNVMIGVHDELKLKSTASVEKVTCESPTRIVVDLGERIDLDQD